jgi:cytochrome bd-type quinol oxidase subunit 2
VCSSDKCSTLTCSLTGWLNRTAHGQTRHEVMTVTRQARSALWLLVLVMLVLTNPGLDDYAAWVLMSEGVSSPPLVALARPAVAAAAKAYDLWLCTVYSSPVPALGILGIFVPLP